MPSVFVLHDYDSPRCDLENSGDYGALPIELTEQEIAEIQAATEEFDRIQGILFEKWSEAEEKRYISS